MVIFIKYEIAIIDPSKYMLEHVFTMLPAILECIHLGLNRQLRGSMDNSNTNIKPNDKS